MKRVLLIILCASLVSLGFAICLWFSSSYKDHYRPNIHGEASTDFDLYAEGGYSDKKTSKITRSILRYDNFKLPSSIDQLFELGQSHNPNSKEIVFRPRVVDSHLGGGSKFVLLLKVRVVDSASGQEIINTSIKMPTRFPSVYNEYTTGAGEPIWEFDSNIKSYKPTYFAIVELYEGVYLKTDGSLDGTEYYEILRDIKIYKDFYQFIEKFKNVS